MRRADCKKLQKVFESLPKLPEGDPLTGAAQSVGGSPPSMDRTLGGILGARA